MYRIDAANAAASAPAPAALGTEGFFKNPAGAVPGTTVDADWMNALQESLIAILDDQSIAHSKSDHTKLLQAINSIADAKIVAADLALRGFISGLYVTPHGTSQFDVALGECRNVGNQSTMSQSAAFINKDCNVAWNSGLGAMASGNTWADPYFGNLFAIGKDTGIDINFGVDQSPVAANLLADATASGFTKYRQIGFVVRVGASILYYKNSPGHPSLFKLDQPLHEFNSPISATTELLWDLSVPEGTLHVGNYTVETAADIDQPLYGNIGGPGSTPAPSSTNGLTMWHQVSAALAKASTIVQESETNAGTAPLQGQLATRFSYAGGTPKPNLIVNTNGFRWSRELP